MPFDMVAKARELAISYHGDQKYNDEPYTMHLQRVADRTDGEINKTIAWLHDILEDTDCTPGTLYTFFPIFIVEAVLAISRRKEEGYTAYIQRVNTNGFALAVKIADLEENIYQSFSPQGIKDTVYLRQRYMRAYQYLRYENKG